MVSCGVLNNSKILNKLYIKGMVHAVALGPVRTGRDVKNWGELSLLESMAKSTWEDSGMTPGVLEWEI